MADEFGEKTEAPTPRRRQEARQKGQVARSQDVPAAIVLLAAMIALDTLGPRMWISLREIMHRCLEITDPVKAWDIPAFTGGIFEAIAWIVGPWLLIIFIASFASVFWQVGPLLTWEPLTPSLNKLNPINGFKRLFSARTAVATIINIGKLLLLTAVAWWTVHTGMGRILYSLDMDHVNLYAMAGGLLVRLGIRLAAVMLILALFDYAWQRHKHEKDLRMSKEEIKEEFKRMEGDPQIKRRRREIQMRLAYQRVQRDVPKADVIVTNPTHYAVALKYDPHKMNAPRVVAKGADWMALRIRQIAAANSIPIVERRVLARGLYENVDVGNEIPERFYEAVAEILAYVYELSGKQLRAQPLSLA